jgi:hypothetical protein
MSEFSELKSLLEDLDTKKPSITEAVFPIAARQMQELTSRITKSWNRAYGEFADSRNNAYDIAATFNIPTRVSRGTKEVRNITQDHDHALIRTISWVSDRFKKDYQDDVVKRSGDLRADARNLIDAAESADNIGNPDLRAAAQTFINSFLVFRTAVSDHLYRSVGAISRRSEEIINRFLPPEDRPAKVPGGSSGPRYKGVSLPDTDSVAEKTRELLDHLDTFVRLSEPTIGEIEKMAGLADEVAKELPPESAPPEIPSEPDGPLEPAPVSTENQMKRRHLRSWVELRWEQDPEIGAFI